MCNKPSSTGDILTCIQGPPCTVITCDETGRTCANVKSLNQIKKDGYVAGGYFSQSLCLSEVSHRPLN